MIKVAFQDIDTDTFRVVKIDNLNDEINVCDDDEVHPPLDFDRPIAINTLIDDEDLITLARYYTFIEEEAVAIISSDSFSNHDISKINDSSINLFASLNEAISNMINSQYSTIEEIRAWEKVTQANGDNDWLFVKD